jgi:UPF0271 protein
MRAALRQALDHEVVVGAHAGYEDRRGFGRVELGLDAADATAGVARQLDRLSSLASRLGVRVAYLKLHGALYHRAATDERLAHLVCDLLESHGRLGVLAQPGALLREAAVRGLPTAVEGFADRAYAAGGSLAPRDEPGGVLDHAAALRQALSIALEGRVTALGGKVVDVEVDSICVHGDTRGALAMAVAVRDELTRAGVQVRSCFR